MIRNYITIAIRTIRNAPTYSAVNIIGLAISIGACFLIVQYASFELSYDRFHTRAKDVYRVYLDIYKDGRRETQTARVSPAVATEFRNEFSAIESFTRLVILGPDGVLTHDDKYTAESDIFLADSAFFDIFSFDLLYGDKRTAFGEPFSVVITESTSEALFGNENPVGQNIVINAKNFDGTSIPFKVTGVIVNFPANSHLQPSVLISYPTLFEFVGHQFDNSWSWNETYTYFRLRPHTDARELEASFPSLVSRFNGQLTKDHLDWRYRLQPIEDIHLHSTLLHEISVNGKGFHVYLLLAVGLILLLIAYINFVNLVTVKAIQRAREVGIRKVSGAYRSQLIIQFLIESLLLNGIAIALAIALSTAVGPSLETLLNINLSMELSVYPILWFLFVIWLSFFVLVSGLYPAFVLSGYKPMDALKSSFSSGLSSNTVRKILVVGQFSAAVILVALTLSAVMQVRFMQQQSLGFNPSQIVVLRGPKAHDYGYGTNFSGFKNKVGQLAHVSSVSAANLVPGQEIYWYDDRVTINGNETSGVFSMLAVSPNYFEHFDIELIAGRMFTEEPDDEQTWIINESAMRLLGFEKADDVLGQQINNGLVVGVVTDFHHESLKRDIPPVLFTAGQVFNYYSVRLETTDITGTLAAIKATYNELFPDSPFEYFFLDDFFNHQYATERVFNNLFGLCSGLAILVACLGLFGLSSYMTVRRSKEIGIRKVMGASVSNLVVLLTRDFFKLVLLAGVLSVPIAYFIVEQWLNNYAFRIDIAWWLMAAPLILILFLALATVCIQTLKTAMINPSFCLRHE